MIPILLFLQNADPLNRVLAFEQPVGPLRGVIRELSSTSGIKLDVSPAIWDSCIYVHSKDLSIKEIMDGIADATFGDWVLDQGTYFLRASSMKEKQGIYADQALFQASIEKWIAKQKAVWTAPELTEEAAREKARQWNTLSQDATSAKYAKIAQMEASDPGTTFLGRVLLTLSPKSFAVGSESSRIVFSTQPTAGQLRFSTDALEAELARLRREKFTAIQHDMPLLTNIVNCFADDRDPSRPMPQLGPSHLAIRRGDQLSQSSVTFTQYRNDGAVLGSLTTTLPSVATPQIDKLTGEFKLSEPASRLASLFARVAHGDKLDQPEQVAAFLQPDKQEPLSLVGTPFMRAYSHIIGPNVVAIVPDYLIFGLIGAGHTASIATNANLLLFPQNISAPFKLGRIAVIRPTTRASLPNLNLDRSAFHAVVDKLLSQNPMGREEWETYSSAHQGFFESTLLRLAYAYLGERPTLLSQPNPALTLYRLLEPEQRVQLQKEQTLTWAQLKSPAQAGLLKLLYLSPGLLRLEEPAASLDKMSDDELMYDVGEMHHIRQEPTFSFPSNPTEVKVRPIVSHSLRFICSETPDSRQDYGDEGADNIARRHHSEARAPAGLVAPARPYYLPVEVTTVRLRIEFEPDLVMIGSVPLKRVNKLPQAVLRAKLPKEYQALLDVADKAVAREYSGVQSPPAGGGAPAKP